jgi:putative oxidoreductase
MAHLLARALVALIFIISGIGKIFGFAATAKMMGDTGFPIPELFLVGAIVVELGGGLALLAGWQTKWVALALFLFLIPTTLVFHAAGIGDPTQGQMQMINTLKNIAIMGGLLKFFLDGPGAWAVDTRA